MSIGPDAVKEGVTDEIKSKRLSGITTNVTASEIKVAVDTTPHEANQTRSEEDVVVTTIKTNELIHRDISDYLLRDIVKATIKVLDDYRAERAGSDPACP